VKNKKVHWNSSVSGLERDPRVPISVVAVTWHGLTLFHPLKSSQSSIYGFGHKGGKLAGSGHDVNGSFQNK
jgi:hypothetical protein